MRTAKCFLVAVAASVVMVATVACGSDADKKDPVTTNATARQQIINYFQQTADTLPWPATLSQTIPGVSAVEFTPSPLPCDLDDDNPEQAYSWTYRLWLLLPADTDNATAQTQLAETWQKLRFDVATDDGTVRATTSDGYRLSARDGAAGVPVGIQSPCFPKSQLDRTQPWPDRIESTG